MFSSFHVKKIQFLYQTSPELVKLTFHFYHFKKVFPRFCFHPVQKKISYDFLYICVCFTELAESLPNTQRSPYPTKRRNYLYFYVLFLILHQNCLKFDLLSVVCCVLGASAGAKSSTLPLPHRLNVEKPVPRERDRGGGGGMDGYYR